MAVEQLCAVYKISMVKCLYFIAYFNRRLSTWLILLLISALFRYIDLMFFQ